MGRAGARVRGYMMRYMQMDFDTKLCELYGLGCLLTACAWL